MKVIVDSRETEKRKKKAKKYFKNIEIKQLNSGDYVSGNCAVEFKSTDDFISSVKDNRIFNQAIRMKEDYLNSFIIMYGSVKKAMDKTRYNRNMKYFSVNQYIGALSSLAQITNVLHVDNETQAFKLCLKLFEKSNDGKNREVAIPKGRKEKNKMVGVLMMIGGINSERATKIIEELKVKNLTQLCALTEEDIKSIDGFGDKMADKIVKWLN